MQDLKLIHLAFIIPVSLMVLCCIIFWCISGYRKRGETVGGREKNGVMTTGAREYSNQIYTIDAGYNGSYGNDVGGCDFGGASSGGCGGDFGGDSGACGGDSGGCGA